MLYARPSTANAGDTCTAMKAAYRWLFEVHPDLFPTVQMSDRDFDTLKAWTQVCIRRVMELAARASRDLAGCDRFTEEQRELLDFCKSIVSHDDLHCQFSASDPKWDVVRAAFRGLLERCPNTAAARQLRRALSVEMLLCQFHVLRAWAEKLASLRLVRCKAFRICQRA